MAMLKVRSIEHMKKTSLSFHLLYGILPKTVAFVIGNLMTFSNRNFTAISMFSGGGGLDLGIEDAGFQTLACIEQDENCCTTLKKNQPQFLQAAKVIQSDVLDVNVVDLMASLDLMPGQLDLLFGGPPCQTFSQIGKLHGVNDPRGQLLFAPLQYAKVLKPKAILVENVKALTTAKDADGIRGGVLTNFIAGLRSLGYTPYHAVLNALDFGVAQSRQRTFIVGISSDYDCDFSFPVPTHGPERALSHLTVGNVLIGINRPKTKEDTDWSDSHVDITPARDRERISYVPEGAYLAKCIDAPSDIRGRLSPKDTTKFLRLNREKHSNTLRCGEIFFHPLDDRYLTPREYMRIHGFPDEYKLSGPIRGRSGTVRNLDQHRQVANSVPPPLAMAVANQVMLALKEAREACKEQLSLQKKIA